MTPVANRVCSQKISHKNVSSALLLLVALAALSAAGGCDKLKARDLLNKGVTAYANGQYDVAVNDFQQAKDLDPDLLNARLFLATAYATQYTPGAPSDDNTRMGTQAVTEFQDVLTMDPSNLRAIDGLGSMLFQMAASPFDPDKFKEAEKYQLMHISIAPNDPQPYYWVGVIDWTLAYHANAEIRSKYNNANPKKQIKDADPLPPDLRDQYSQDYGTMVDDGIDKLNKAIQLQPDYDDAMAYLNLLLRRKADMVASPDDRDALEKQADALVDQVKEIKERKAAAPTGANPG
jgi:tetratricopeptide (TPR) repeat protein